MSKCVTLACALAALVAGCGDDDGPGPSDASDADAGTGVFPVVPPSLPEPVAADPAPPEPPRFSTCAPGWRSVAAGADGSSAARCEPYDGERAPACADDEIAPPGSSTCGRLGTACAADGWPSDLPVGASVLWARAGAAAGGSGTQASPFATVTDAIAAATPGTIVAIAVGTYDEQLAVPAGVTLWGACVSGTRLSATLASSTTATVTVRGAETGIRNLSLGGNSRALVAVRGADVTIEHVATTDAVGRAWTALAGSRIVAHDVAIRDTTPGRASEGHAIRVEAGADVTVDHATIERNALIAVYVLGAGATVRMQDATVRETAAAPTGSYGRGLVADGGAVVELERVVVEDSRELGIAVWSATLVLTDVVVRRTASDGSMSGIGLQLADHATVEARRVLLDSNASSSVLSIGPGVSLLLEDALVRRSLPDATGSFGFGIAMRDGIDAHLTRVVVEQAHELAVHSLGARSIVVAEDLAIRDTEPSVAGVSGRALEAGPGSSMDVTRLEIAGCRVVGAFCAGDAASGLSATVVLRDVHVRDVAPSAVEETAGHGIEARHGCSLTVERALIERTHDVALVAVDDGTTIVASDVRVVGVAPSPAGFGANGIQAQAGASMALTRARVDDVQNTALVSFGNARMTCTDVEVGDRVGPAPVDAATIALHGAAGATLDVTRARVATTFSHSVFAEGDSTHVRVADLTIAPTGAVPDDAIIARGPLAEFGATLELERMDATGLTETAVVGISEGTHVSLRDAFIHDLLGRAADGSGGIAVYAGLGAAMSLERVRVSRARDVAVVARDIGTTLTARQLEVTDTLARQCASTTCAEAPSGMGVGVYENATLAMEQFVVTRAALAGVQLARGGAADIMDGVVSGCPIGANVQTDGFDPRRLTTRVVYRDNARNLAADTLPLPDVVVPPIDAP